MKLPRLARAALMGLSAALTACVSNPSAEMPYPNATAAAAAPAALPAAMAALRHPDARLFTGGQPDRTLWAELPQAGVTTVINLRPASEMAGRDEAAEVAAAGLNYRALPIAGPADITLEHARALRTLIDAAPGKVLVHCASGNRVGALLALAAAQMDGKPTDQAMREGEAAGMTKLAPHVRELLGL